MLNHDQAAYYAYTIDVAEMDLTRLKQNKEQY